MIAIALRSYGSGYIAVLSNRRNIPHIIYVLFVTGCITTAVNLGITDRVPRPLCVLIVVLYILYMMSILIYAGRVGGLARMHLQMMEGYLYEISFGEKEELIKKRPWYFLDKGERIAGI